MGKRKASSNETVIKRKYNQLADNLSGARGTGLSAAALRAEFGFSEYMKLLKKFAQRYCVMIAVNDTPVGPHFTREMAKKLQDIGLDINIFGNYRCAYAALIDSGVLIFEELKTDTLDSIDKKIILDGNEIRLISVGCNCGFTERAGKIQINGTEHSVNLRGLNIVVYDKVTQLLIDSVNFDTYSDDIAVYRPSGKCETIENFAAQHPDISVLCCTLPMFPEDHLTAYEKSIKKMILYSLRY